MTLCLLTLETKHKIYFVSEQLTYRGCIASEEKTPGIRAVRYQVLQILLVCVHGPLAPPPSLYYHRRTYSCTFSLSFKPKRATPPPDPRCLLSALHKVCGPARVARIPTVRVSIFKGRATRSTMTGLAHYNTLGMSMMYYSSTR